MSCVTRRPLLAGLLTAGFVASVSTAAQAQMTGSGTPYQQNVSCLIASGASFCSITFKVPANTTLVIQSVSAYRLGPNSSTANAFLEAEFGNSLATYPLTQIPVASATPFPGTSLSLTAFAQSGARSFFEIYRGSTSGQETAYFTVSGYTIPAS